MHPSVHARQQPDKPAIIVAETGEVVRYGELDAVSNQAAHLFRARGLGHGDVIAFMLDNRAHYLSLVWGAQRAGLRYVCISARLTPDEIDYILENSGACLLIAAAPLGDVVQRLTTDVAIYAMGGAIGGWPVIEEELPRFPSEPIADERAGIDMLYSSGTTGRPKGVKMPLPPDPAIDGPNGLTLLASAAFGLGEDSIYLSPAPLYHAAPLRWTMSVHRLGGTVVLMQKFDAEGALATIETYRCNAAQFVPTHFIRMLKLPDEQRLKYDISSMKTAIHAAAPCPIPVKQAMIDWWGPVLLEYYAGSEGNGLTFATSQDWLQRKGTTGRAILGTLHIMADDKETELSAGQEGLVFFESDTEFEYHDDPEKTRSSRNSRGWTTLGDIGRVDDDGFLYLTDRKSFLIISGGVNIYPQEIENHLITHPQVTDVAVVGGPHDEMGEEVIAVVQPSDMSDATDALRQELIAYARQKLSAVKIPRRIDFMESLPRHDTGKLYKRLLRDTYWADKN